MAKGRMSFAMPAVLALACVMPAPGAETKADLELKALAAQVAASTGEAEPLRQSLLQFQHKHLGTPQAVGAAALVRQLPSPFDKYDAATINSLEKFSWQPRELVAIFGEHRGRQGGSVT